MAVLGLRRTGNTFPERAFVVGPIVDDFHALDYRHMWATAFGAVQHLLKEHDALEDRVKRIEAQLGL